jgi:hypothetical protein
LIAKVKEKTMANKRFWLGILVLALVFGLTVVGCDDGSTGGFDGELNGIWVSDIGETKLNNGNFEFSNYDMDGTVTEKGTYILNGNIITFNQTHVYGGSYYNLEDKLYSKNEFKTALQITDEELIEHYPWAFTEYVADYFPKENKYIFTHDDGTIITYTKKK